eukprot:889488-Pyramimonas_sp.AAC.1
MRVPAVHRRALTQTGSTAPCTTFRAPPLRPRPAGARRCARRPTSASTWRANASTKVLPAFNTLYTWNTQLSLLPRSLRRRKRYEFRHPRRT